MNKNSIIIYEKTVKKNTITKHVFRKKVWEHLTKNNIADYPRPIYGRIPNFIGSQDAAKKLLELNEFKNAKCVEVNPDKPQEGVRLLVLENKKELYVPIPHLKNGFLRHITVLDTDNEYDMKNAVSYKGLAKSGKIINVNESITIDLLVVGSVAVSKDGYRIGKGRGYADLEYAILSEMKAVNDETLIVTNVHDSQVFDSLPPEIFQPHDVPVNIIITPTKIIKIDKHLPRPTGIFWNLISDRKLMAILQKLKDISESAGKDKQNNNEIKMHKRPMSKKKKQLDFSLMVSNIQKNVRIRDIKNPLKKHGIEPDFITWRGNKGFCYLNYTKPNANVNEERKSPMFANHVIQILQNLNINTKPDAQLYVRVMETISRIETTNITAV